MQRRVQARYRQGGADGTLDVVCLDFPVRGSERVNEGIVRFGAQQRQPPQRVEPGGDDNQVISHPVDFPAVIDLGLNRVVAGMDLAYPAEHGADPVGLVQDSLHIDREHAAVGPPDECSPLPLGQQVPGVRLGIHVAFCEALPAREQHPFGTDHLNLGVVAEFFQQRRGDRARRLAAADDAGIPDRQISQRAQMLPDRPPVKQTGMRARLAGQPSGITWPGKHDPVCWHGVMVAVRIRQLREPACCRTA